MALGERFTAFVGKTEPGRNITAEAVKMIADLAMDGGKDTASVADLDKMLTDMTTGTGKTRGNPTYVQQLVNTPHQSMGEKTPLAFAQDHNNQSLVDVLKKHGAEAKWTERHAQNRTWAEQQR